MDCGLKNQSICEHVLIVQSDPSSAVANLDTVSCVGYKTLEERQTQGVMSTERNQCVNIINT